jgi:hypothetical protein
MCNFELLILVPLEKRRPLKGEVSGGGFTCRVDLNPESRSSWVEFLLGEFPKSILRGLSLIPIRIAAAAAVEASLT